MSHGRKGKNAPAFCDFIALGPKASGSSSSVSSQKSKSSTSASSASTSSTSSKKFGESSVSKNPNISTSAASPRSTVRRWESYATEEVNVSTLAYDVISAASKDPVDVESVTKLMCSAVRLLSTQRAKPDQLLYLSLMLVVKQFGHVVVMRNELVLEAIASLLKRDVKESYKAKGNALVSVLACSLLQCAFAKESVWPELLLRVYIDDAKGERMWVGHPECKVFVDNLCTAFNTKLPSQLMSFFPKPVDSSGRESPPVTSRPGSGSATPTRISGEESSSLQGSQELSSLALVNDDTKESHSGSNTDIFPRFTSLSLNYIENLVMESLCDHFGRRQGPDNITRSLLKFLVSVSGLQEVRLAVMPRLEMWIMNPKVSREAQELLHSIAVNANSAKDVEVIGHFTKLRLKNKPSINLYLHCAREIANANHDNLPVLIKQTIFNELSNARNPNNMAVLGTLFALEPERSATSLASVFLELLLQKECYLRALRVLLREIVRALRFDINLQAFCLQLMQSESAFTDASFQDFDPKERVFTSITDLVMLALMLGLTPSVREILIASNRGEKRDMGPYKNFLKQAALIQRDAMWWFLQVVLPVFGVSSQSYQKCLHKVLFMVNVEEYYSIDMWPPENERHLYFKALSELPLMHETVVRVLLIGLSPSLPLYGRNAIDLVEVLVNRAAGLHHLLNENFMVLPCEQPNEMIELLFKLTAYSFPDTIAMPKDYSPPSLAITATYWKAWVILLVYCAHNPSQLGFLARDNYPTLKAFVEMCITNQFAFPPLTVNQQEADVIRSQELQTATQEKQTILTLEKHLAKETITEANSLLLTQLMLLNPTGPFRQPPQQIMEHLKNLNQQSRLGHLLCRSREPDILLDILQRQNSNEAIMPWLSDLVEASEGAFNTLPVQCLCEFLLSTDIDQRLKAIEEATISKVSSNKELGPRERKVEQLLLYLQQMLHSGQSNIQIISESLEYFLRRLSSPHTLQRRQALQALRLVLTPLERSGDEEFGEDKKMEEFADDTWLLLHFPRLPSFSELYSQISSNLRTACQTEMDAEVVSLYIRFLCHYMPDSLSEMASLCSDMVLVIVERSAMLPALLPGHQCQSKKAKDTFTTLLNLFNRFMTRLIQSKESTESCWGNEHSSELLTLVWEEDERRKRTSAVVHHLLVHAQIILLTFKPTEDLEQFEEMKRIWFPRNTLPRAYLLETQDEVQFVPDWLKLKMIRSEVQVLVDAALLDLDPNQLVLFIQSFGIPVKTMSKLLQALDNAAQNDPRSVLVAVMDKNYMAQLVVVQHKRGAVGGEAFAKALGLDIQVNLTHTHKNGQEAMAVDENQIESERKTTASFGYKEARECLSIVFKEETVEGKRDDKVDHAAIRKTLCRDLLKALSDPNKERMKVSKAVMDFISTKASHSIDNLISVLDSHASMSNLVFRHILMNAKQKLSADFEHACHEILHHLEKSEKSRSPLLSMLRTYFQKAYPSKVWKSKRRKSEHELRLSDKNRGLESVVQAKVKEFVTSRGKEEKKELTYFLTEMLDEEDRTNENVASSPQFPPSTKCCVLSSGLVVDWLESMDPELLNLTTQQRQKILFSKRRINCRPHLLTLLANHGSLSGLRSLLEETLSQQHPHLDPKSILDFVTALIDIPRLWQNRDKHVPKHVLKENVFDYLIRDEEKLHSLLRNVLNEEIDVVAPNHVAMHLRSRLPLLLHCIGDRRRANTAFLYLSQFSQSASRSTRQREIAKQLMLHLYIKLPYVALNNANLAFTDEDFSIVKGTVGSPVDPLAHILISLVANTQHGRNWALQMLEFEMGLRKLAATHPLLVLRSLSLVAASLKGRTELLNFHSFRKNNGLNLFRIMLGVIDLTRPHVFNGVFKSDLQDCFKAFLSMMTSYPSNSIQGLVEEFVTLLHHYTRCSPYDAKVFLQENQSALTIYFDQNLEMQSLKELLGFTRNAANSQRDYVSNDLASYMRRHDMEVRTEAHRINEAITVSSKSDEDLINALTEAHISSQGRAKMLSLIRGTLANLMSHQTKGVRDKTGLLIIKLLKASPEDSSFFVPFYKLCLRSTDAGVAESALTKLPEFTILAREHMTDLLIEAFDNCLTGIADLDKAFSETISIAHSLCGY